ncbi:MAG: histidine kinase [Blautia sp.]
MYILNASSRRFQNLSLKYKILTIISAGFLILFLTGMTAIAVVSKTYEDKLYQSIAASMSYSASELSNQLESVDSIVDSLLSSQTIQTNLEEMQDCTQKSQKKVYNTRIYDALSNYLFSFNSDSISYMAIVQGNETVSTSASKFSELPPYFRSSLLERAQKGEGATTVVPDYGMEYGIFIVKELRKIDSLSLEPLGVLIINLSPQALIEKAVASYSEYDTLSCLLFDEETLIYNSGALPASKVREFIGRTSSDYDILKIEGESFFVVLGKIPLYNWDYVCGVSYNSIYQTITLSGRLFLLIMILALALVSYFAIKLILALFYRFDKLIENMKSFGEGSYQVPDLPQPYEEDEIGLLYKNFDAMVEKINLLIQENYVNELLKKEAQIKAMESQMDPHFLYNTLDSINWRARMVNSPEICQITTALGSLLRLSLGKTSRHFTLGQEMDLVTNYMTIQKIRYQRRLEFTTEIPKEFMDCQIPKFTIQPLLENAIRYGLEESSDTCYISIVCRQLPDRMVLTITNTGSAFEENAMEKLMAGEIQPHGFGIGILNIHRRLQMTYGEDFGLRLYNMEDEKTYEECAVAEVHIPRTKGEEIC